MMFCLQLWHEWVRLVRRRSCWLGATVCLAAEGIFVLLLRVPGARGTVAGSYEKMRLPLGEEFSGLTEAAYLRTIIVATIGWAAVAWVSAELIGREAEDGTLRMVFLRPVTRRHVLAAKLLAGVSHAVLLVLFISATSLGLALCVEKPGPLVYASLLEAVVGAYDFWPGLEHYAIVTALLTVSAASFSLLVLTLSCFPMKPATAAIAALSLLIADETIRHLRGLASLSPYFLTARLMAWVQGYNDPLPWVKIGWRYGELLAFDALLLLIAAWAWSRREFKP